MRKFGLIMGLFLLSLLAAAQQKYEQVNQLWFGYYNSIKITQRLAVNSDLQGRTTDWYKQWSQVLARTGLAYRLNEKFTFTLGFADFLFFAKGNKATRNEYRPWVEIAISDKHEKLKISHRFRFESRNFQQVVNDELVDKYTSNYRFRYRIDLQYPIWSKTESDKSLAIQFGNEIMANAGKSIVYNYFDQNRTWVAVLYSINKGWSVQLQYITIFQQLASGNTIDHINVGRINIYHTIDLRKNDNNTAK